MRDVINKGITEKDLYSSVGQAFELGWNVIKLYFMVGHPTETLEDLDGITQIARNIIDMNYQIKGPKGGRVKVTVSASNFVPKPWTPFQWEPQDSENEFMEKHNLEELPLIITIQKPAYWSQCLQEVTGK